MSDENAVLSCLTGGKSVQIGQSQPKRTDRGGVEQPLRAKFEVMQSVF